MFRLVGETLKSNGLFPPTGIDPATHLLNILLAGEMNAMIEDTKTGKIIANYEQVKIATKNWTVDARGVVGEDAEFVAIVQKDESEIGAII
jgi:hypothetical protein